MQDIQLINAGQLFPNSNTNSGGGGVVLDRRLRQNHLQNQALNCPRCDSLNTKFCYYNNYNLSQPRHFCKSCGRYWTKGGVLRNVPVGGGCRKSSKRSSSAASKSSKCLDEVRSEPKSNNSNSSSESCSLTGTGNAAVVGGDKAAIATTPCSSAATPPSTETVSNSFSAVFGFRDAKYIFPQIRNPNFGSELTAAAKCGGVDSCGDGGGGFTDIRSFSSLNNETAARNFSTLSYDAVSPYEQYDRPYDQWQFGTEERASGGGYVDPTIQIDQHHHHHQSSILGSEPLSWHQEQKQQQEMFGLTSADDQGYWSQQQWSNPDKPHLYLP